MCYIIVERFSVCRCTYHRHNVDMCAAYGTQGHHVMEKTVLVGYACERHSGHADQGYSQHRDGYSDSGYQSQSHHSGRDSSRRHRR